MTLYIQVRYNKTYNLYYKVPLLVSSININPTTIGEEILVKQEHYKKLRVPDYQRNYVWDEDRIDEFWLDLTERKSLPFLGSFIIKEEANK